MPTISFFFGMMVQMYWRDHAPPHFHVQYNEYEGSVSIETGEVIEKTPTDGASHSQGMG
jgi:hypothetical protein